MRAVKLVLGASIPLVLWGCAPLLVPPEYRELKQRINTAAPSDAQYENARDLLQSADVAAEKRDQSNLVRYSKLGLKEVDIADAANAYNELMTAIETQQKQNEALSHDIFSWRTTVDHLLAEEARNQIRRHVETIIENETRDAAAAEELNAQMGDVPESTQDSARQTVAAELLAMAQIRVEVARLLVRNEVLLPEQLQEMEGALALMEASRHETDTAAVFQFAETNIAQFIQCMDAAWIVEPDRRVQIQTELSSQLKNAFSEISEEDIGLVIPLPLTADAKSKRLQPGTVATLTAARALMQKNDRLALLVVISGVRNSTVAASSPSSSRKASGTLREMIEQTLTDSVPLATKERALSMVMFSKERPLRVLSGTSVSGALVFVSLP